MSGKWTRATGKTPVGVDEQLKENLEKEISALQQQMGELHPGEIEKWHPALWGDVLQKIADITHDLSLMFDGIDNRSTELLEEQATLAAKAIKPFELVLESMEETVKHRGYTTGVTQEKIETVERRLKVIRTLADTKMPVEDRRKMLRALTSALATEMPVQDIRESLQEPNSSALAAYSGSLSDRLRKLLAGRFRGALEQKIDRLEEKMRDQGDTMKWNEALWHDFSSETAHIILNFGRLFIEDANAAETLAVQAIPPFKFILNSMREAFGKSMTEKQQKMIHNMESRLEIVQTLANCELPVEKRLKRLKEIGFSGLEESADSVGSGVQR